MAPERIDPEGGSCPTYTVKADVWSRSEYFLLSGDAASPDKFFLLVQKYLNHGIFVQKY